MNDSHSISNLSSTQLYAGSNRYGVTHWSLIPFLHWSWTHWISPTLYSLLLGISFFLRLLNDRSLSLIISNSLWFLLPTNFYIHYPLFWSPFSYSLSESPPISASSPLQMNKILFLIKSILFLIITLKNSTLLASWLETWPYH